MTEVPPWNKPISLQRMRVVLNYEEGWKSLRGYLESVELERKRKIIKRTPCRHYTTHKVTLSAIARYAPEIVPPEILGDRGGTRNDRAAVLALQRIRRDQDERMKETMANVAANVFEKRIRPYRLELEALKSDTIRKAARKKTRTRRKVPESLE